MVDRQTEYITRVDYTLELNDIYIYFNYCQYICYRFIVFHLFSVFPFLLSWCLTFFGIFLPNSSKQNQIRWKQQLQNKQQESECTKDTIKILVQNILPAHVGEFRQISPIKWLHRKLTPVLSVT